MTTSVIIRKFIERNNEEPVAQQTYDFNETV